MVQGGPVPAMGHCIATDLSTERRVAYKENGRERGERGERGDREKKRVGGEGGKGE